MKHNTHSKNIWVFLLYVLLAFLPINAYAGVEQSQQRIKLGEAIKQIEKETDYTFMYDKNSINLEEYVSFVLDSSNIQKTVNTLLKSNKSLTFKIINRQIILSKVEQKEPSKVKGTIVDTSGLPLIGVNITVKGNSSRGTISDFDGNFSLNAQKGESLVISYIGYATQNIKLHNLKDLSITLHDDSELLDEVVVVGYGTQKKMNLTGAVETVDSKSIENRPIRSATDALQGAVPGLVVTSNTGAPGQFSSLQIRGKTSINSGGALVMIDGMPGDINHVSPQDIESISVLKDAASAAIYGARAAEGVILITTKRGKSQKTKVDYSGNFSYNIPTRLPKSNNAYDHALLSNTAFKNAGLAVNFSDEALEAIKDPSIIALPRGNDWLYTSDVDWIDMMMDHSFQQNHNLSISKAADKLNYLFSASWLDQNGMFSEYGPDNFDRVNIRSNVGVDIIKDKLTFDSKINYTHTDKKYHPQFSSWSIPYITFIQAGPNMPVYDENGNYARYRMQGNPIQALQEGGEGTFKQQKIEGIFELTYKPIKGLLLKATGGAIIRNNQTKEFRRAYGKYGPNGLISEGAGQHGPNSVDQNSSSNRYLTGQLIAEYSKVFKEVHDFKILGGWSAEESVHESLGAKRTDIVGNELPSLNLGSTEGWSNSAGESDWALLSGFMRLNYAYKSKYLFETNFRADASSRFSKKNRWGVFPSASLGWRISEENFMKNQKVFSNLKLRMSWGQLGNQSGLGYYDHIAQYSVGGYYPFDSNLGQWAVANKLPSEDRTWETVEMKNIGLEMGFLKNRLTTSIEYFVKRNKDMLVGIELPSVIGIDVPTGNYGELKVNGWELSIGWRDQIEDFSYGVSFNISDQKDKLVDYGVEYNGFTAGINQRVQGYSLGSIFGYKTDGYFSSQEEADKSAVINRAITGAGDIKYIDKDKDGKISAPNDLEYLGTTTPRFVYGLNFNGQWRGFDFSMIFQGVGKRNYYIGQEIMAPFSVTWGNFSYTMHNDYWTEDNPDAALPRHYAGAGHNYHTSDHWMQNASYLRLKNLQIGYSFDKKLISKLKLERCRVYFSGENVAEISSLNKNFDPELTTTSGFMYPIMRSFSLGLNLTF